MFFSNITPSKSGAMASYFGTRFSMNFTEIAPIGQIKLDTENLNIKSLLKDINTSGIKSKINTSFSHQLSQGLGLFAIGVSSDVGLSGNKKDVVNLSDIKNTKLNLKTGNFVLSHHVFFGLNFGIARALFVTGVTGRYYEIDSDSEERIKSGDFQKSWNWNKNVGVAVQFILFKLLAEIRLMRSVGQNVFSKAKIEEEPKSNNQLFYEDKGLKLSFAVLFRI
ncbi:hypothetical protein [Candidatus Nesciobacter abundans]|uniref:Outer membrane beta-barrel protein n=2 Tax=Candidatus Nesciobacter abundans TaxID=2601668 RepID=A0A5C0UIK7_9PROT|nr:hypothetical protein [Candidatus Nesciobacter abundans]QEK39262.1 hypothetical protein FZC36_02410 [Candidatus Nesciobacter abundans]